MSTRWKVRKRKATRSWGRVVFTAAPPHSVCGPSVCGRHALLRLLDKMTRGSAAPRSLSRTLTFPAPSGCLPQTNDGTSLAGTRVGSDGALTTVAARTVARRLAWRDSGKQWANPGEGMEPFSIPRPFSHFLAGKWWVHKARTLNPDQVGPWMQSGDRSSIFRGKPISAGLRLLVGVGPQKPKKGSARELSR